MIFISAGAATVAVFIELSRQSVFIGRLNRREAFQRFAVMKATHLVARPSDSLSDNSAFRIGIGPAEWAGAFGVGPDIAQELAP
jgi:hypothetical protein